MDKTKAVELLHAYFGKTINFSYEIVKQIEKTEMKNQAEVIQQICELFDDTESDASIELQDYISDKELEKLRINDGELVNQILESNLKKAYLIESCEEEFYMFLWSEMVHTFSELKDRAFALYYIIIDRRIPYFSVRKGLKMSEEDFREYRRQNKNSIAKTKFVLYNTYSQKTEEASILLDEITGRKSYEERVVLLVSILDTLRQEQRMLRKRLQETEQ